jgi:hypothetical protein
MNYNHREYKRRFKQEELEHELYYEELELAEERRKKLKENGRKSSKGRSSS